MKNQKPIYDKKPIPAKVPFVKSAERSAEPKRAIPKGSCPLYKKCSGCQLQNMSYPEQLAWKQGKINRLLQSYGRVSPIVGMEKPQHYRNKVQAAFTLTRDKKITSGVYQSTTQTVVPVDSCMIEDQMADEIIVYIRKLAKDFKYMPYSMQSGMGMLRHVLVRRGFVSGQTMVVLVTATPMLPAKNNFVKALLKKYPNITTIVHNINPHDTNLILGNRENVLYGRGYIEDTLCGCVFRISAKSFYQISPVQTEILYRKAIALADLTGKETVIDAYCGIGTIGLVASQSAKNIIGIESNHDAVKDAIYNCRKNGITNARFYQGDAGEFLTHMVENGETAEIVFMDPPRAGSDEKFLSAVVALSPKKVVYISCNPETLARDLEYFTRFGYDVKEIHPVDMFPYTNHVEVVVSICGKDI